MRPLGPRQAIDQAIGSVRLKVAADLVKLLAAIAHDLASLADVVEFVSKFCRLSFLRAILLLVVMTCLRLLD